MAIIFVDQETPTGVIDGVNIFFALANAPQPPLSLVLALNGLVQNQIIDFTLIGNTITYINPPQDQDRLVAWYRYDDGLPVVSSVTEGTTRGFSANVSTDIGKVRLYIADMDPAKPIFPDDSMIQVFLDEELGDLKCAAALALECVAGNRALVLQVIQLLDLKTDGMKTAQGLLAVAQRFRDTANDDWSGIDFAQVTDSSEFAYREYLMKQIVAQYR